MLMSFVHFFVLSGMQSRGAPVTVVSCLNSDQEAAYVLEKISTLVTRKQASFGSFGVLYRTRAQVPWHCFLSKIILCRIERSLHLWLQSIFLNLTMFLPPGRSTGEVVSCKADSLHNKWIDSFSLLQGLWDVDNASKRS